MANPIKQPDTLTPASFMHRALDLAADAEKTGRGSAYGTVIVRAGEVEAIIDACRRTVSNHLSGAVIYTSGGAPCPMCATACYWAVLDQIYHAHDAENISAAGAPGYGKC